MARGENRALGRQIRIYGAVAQSREYAVSTIPAVRVDTVEMGRGDEVEAGELLFTLDLEDLKEQIARRELAIKKLEVQISTLQYNQGLADEERVKDTSRLLEDYLDIAEDHEIAVERARIRESEALQDLEKHEENMVQVTDSEGREAAWEEYEAWKEYGESLQEEVERLTAKLDAAQQEVERAQAEPDEAKHMAGVFFSSESVSMAEDGSAAVPEAKEAEPEAAGEVAGEAAGIQSCAEETEGVNQPGEGDSAGEMGTAELSGETGTSGETGIAELSEETETSEETDAAELPGEMETSEEADAAELPEETEKSEETDAAELPDKTEVSKETGTTELPGETEASGEAGTAELPGEMETSGEADGTESETVPEGEKPDLTKLQECLEEAITARDACAAALEKAQRNLQEHQSEWKAEPDFTAEDAAQRSWEDQEETLRRNAESADWAYQDAQRQMEQALSEAQREVDDSVEPEELQDTLTLNQMELSFLKKELNQYQKLQEQEGKVSAAQNGIITAVNVTAGNDTPDGAAVIYADKEGGRIFLHILAVGNIPVLRFGRCGL